MINEEAFNKATLELFIPAQNTSITDFEFYAKCGDSREFIVQGMPGCCKAWLCNMLYIVHLHFICSGCYVVLALL